MESVPRDATGLAARLGEIERALDAGTYRPGPWQRLVADASGLPPVDRRSLEATLDRVSEKLHRRREFPSFAVERGMALESIGAALGLALVGLGAALDSALALGAAAALLTVALQPLLKVSTGLALGIGYAYFYVWRGEPRFKLRFGSYLAAAPWKRFLLHGSGVVGSPLGVGVAWAAARSSHPTLARALLALAGLHVAFSIVVLVLAALGVRRLPGIGAIRFNSAGAAGHELRQLVARGRDAAVACSAMARAYVPAAGHRGSRTRPVGSM